MVLELTEENFTKEVKEAKTPVIIDFWASWCGPCKMLAPVFIELSKGYEGKLKFAKLSTEDYPDLAGEYDITVTAWRDYNKKVDEKVVKLKKEYE